MWGSQIIKILTALASSIFNKHSWTKNMTFKRPSTMVNPRSPKGTMIQLVWLDLYRTMLKTPITRALAPRTILTNHNSSFRQRRWSFTRITSLQSAQGIKQTSEYAKQWARPAFSKRSCYPKVWRIKQFTQDNNGQILKMQREIDSLQQKWLHQIRTSRNSCLDVLWQSRLHNHGRHNNCLWFRHLMDQKNGKFNQIRPQAQFLCCNHKI